MRAVIEIDTFADLRDRVWAGAVHTLEAIAKAGLEKEFMAWLSDFEEEIFDRTPTITEINDFLWFDSDYVFESFGLDENGDPIKEE